MGNKKHYYNWKNRVLKSKLYYQASTYQKLFAQFLIERVWEELCE